MLRLRGRSPIPFDLYDPITPLPSIYATRAREELNEVVTEVSSHLERFRLSISSLPHITCPTDDIFLLAFLRYEKYDHANAMKRLENFCAFRSLPGEGKPEWFQYDSLDRDLYKRIGELRYLIPLGSTFDGTSCVLIKAERLNFDVVTFHEVMCTSQIWNDVMLLDPRVQIGGFIFLMDMAGVKLRELQRMSDQQVSEFGCKYFQEALPLRAKKNDLFQSSRRI
uniref:Clavesin-1 n=1 Tax=Schistocephalus solidus TaxID=70667 RepID=A0A0V0J649_SCHSO